MFFGKHLVSTYVFFYPRHQEIEEEFNIMMTDARDSSAAVAAPGCLDAFPAVNSWGPPLLYEKLPSYIGIIS